MTHPLAWPVIAPGFLQIGDGTGEGCELSFTPNMAHVVLKPGHVRPIHAGHPWVYRQAVAELSGALKPGAEVDVKDPQGKFLGRGFYSDSKALAVRVCTRTDIALGSDFFVLRIRQAKALRERLGLPSAETTGYRLVHGEADGLPGLIVDVFGDVLGIQLNTQGMKQREGMIFGALAEVLAPRAIIDRTPPSATKFEGVEAGVGVVRGDPNVASLVFRERGFSFDLPLTLSQKTGFYFDQRPLRARAEAFARGADVLDVFSFVGAFGLAAARGGASRVTCVDRSASVAEAAAIVARSNGVADRVTAVCEDAETALAKASNSGGHDLVLCDPPKLAPARANREAALHHYRRLAKAAALATKPGGILFFSSCSGSVSAVELQRALALGARDANLHATMLEQHIQGHDHPVPVAFPEGLYLKSLIVRVERIT